MRLKPYWLAAPILALSFFLRHEAIIEMSPVFDEPYYLFNGVCLAQTGRLLELDEKNPPFFAWLIGRAAPVLGKFRDCAALPHTPGFPDSFRYRVDLFSGLPEDAAIRRARWLMQGSWIALAAALLFIAASLGATSWGVLTLLAWLSLEPSLLGHAVLLRNDLLAVSFLALAAAAGIASPSLAASLAAFALFSCAWATKLTASLAGFWLLIGWAAGKLPRRLILLWLLGAAGGWAISRALGYQNLFLGTRDSNRLLTFLDGSISVRPPLRYFVESVFSKFSLGGDALLAAALAACWKKKRLPALTTAALAFAALLFASRVMPGLGWRLVFVIVIGLITAACAEIKSSQAALLILGLLVCETLLHRHALLAYRNPLADAAPRTLDSDCDWGQGLKALAAWRREHPEVPLALARFGTTPPELYGLEDYYRLDSFFPLEGGRPMPARGFNGYVAVSRNFLYGYYVDQPSLRALAQKDPVTCFQDAFCLYKVP